MKKMYSILLMLVFSISFVPASQGVSKEETKEVISLDQSSINVCNLDIATVTVINVDSNFVSENSTINYWKVPVYDYCNYSIAKVNDKEYLPLIRYNITSEVQSNKIKLDTLILISKVKNKSFYFPDAYNLSINDRATKRNNKERLTIRYNKCLDCYFRTSLLTLNIGGSIYSFKPLFI